MGEDLSFQASRFPFWGQMNNIEASMYRPPPRKRSLLLKACQACLSTLIMNSHEFVNVVKTVVQAENSNYGLSSQNDVAPRVDAAPCGDSVGYSSTTPCQRLAMEKSLLIQPFVFCHGLGSVDLIITVRPLLFQGWVVMDVHVEVWASHRHKDLNMLENTAGDALVDAPKFWATLSAHGSDGTQPCFITIPTPLKVTSWCTKARQSLPTTSMLPSPDHASSSSSQPRRGLLPAR